MKAQNSRPTVNYAWVSVRGTETDVKAVQKLIKEDVGEDAFTGSGKCSHVADSPGLFELDYRNFYYSVSPKTISSIFRNYPRLKLRAVAPKLEKYREGHAEAYSLAGSREFVEQVYSDDYERDDYPVYYWWWKDEIPVDCADAAGVIGEGGEIDALVKQDFDFIEDPEGVIVTAYYGSDENLEIPSAIDGKPVVSIGENAFRGSGRAVFLPAFELESVTIPATVKCIQEGAFRDCGNLQQVKFAPESELVSIGRSAFQGTMPERIVLPKSLKSIGAKAFRLCGAEEIQFESGSRLETIGESAFEETCFKSIELPKSLESIGSNAFKFSMVEDIMVEPGNEHFTTAGGALFTKDMTELVRAFDIDADMFSIPSTVTIIRGCALESCKARRVVVPASVVEIADTAFLNECHDAEIQEIEFEEKSAIDRLGESLFADADKLEFVSFPMSLNKFAAWFGPAHAVPFFAPGLPFTEVKPAKYKLQAAVGFARGMGAGRSASDDTRKGYVRYLKSHSMDVLEALDFDADALRWMLDYGCIAAKDAAGLAKAARKSGHDDQADWLTKFSEENASKVSTSKRSRKESGDKPKFPTVAELKKTWKTQKLEDGTYAINSWLGENASTLVPSQIGKATTITVISGYAFAPYNGFDPANKDARENVLENVIVSDGIKQVGYHAFALCRALREVELPASVEEIAKEAFYKCELKRLVVRSSAKIPAHALDNTNFDELYLSGPVGKQADTCVARKILLHKAMPDKDKKAVRATFSKLPNGKDIEYGEWE